MLPAPRTAGWREIFIYVAEKIWNYVLCSKSYLISTTPESIFYNTDGWKYVLSVVSVIKLLNLIILLVFVYWLITLCHEWMVHNISDVMNFGVQIFNDLCSIYLQQKGRTRYMISDELYTFVSLFFVCAKLYFFCPKTKHFQNNCATLCVERFLVKDRVKLSHFL